MAPEKTRYYDALLGFAIFSFFGAAFRHSDITPACSSATKLHVMAYI